MPITADRSILCDTNIVSRAVNVGDRQHTLVSQAILDLLHAGYRMVYAPQTLREFWNVATRPGLVNGLRLTVAQTDVLARQIESTFDLLSDSDAMHAEWRRLVVQHEVKGVQVDDARLAASALVSGCRALLTLNDPDFRRFGVPALHPSEVPAFLTNDVK